MPEELMKKEFPTREDYSKAFKIAKQELESLIKEGIVIGALFYGSTTQDDVYMGSDIDLFVIIRDEFDRKKRQTDENRIKDLEEKIKNLTKVDLNIKPLIYESQTDTELIRYLELNFDFPISDCAFLDYLQTCSRQENEVGKNPFGLLKGFSKRKDKKERINEIELRFDRYFNDLDSKLNDENYHKILGKIIRHPIFVALDTIWVEDGEMPTNENGKLITKKDICRLYTIKFPYMDSKGLFRILRLFERYKGFMDSFSAKEIPQRTKISEKRQLTLLPDISNFDISIPQIIGAYSSLLRDISYELETARNFVLQNIQYLHL